MKKLLTTTAVLSVLATPAFADITIGGDMRWYYQSVDGATSSNLDSDINFKPSFTTETGMTVAADFNINHNGEDDGDNSLTLSKDQWSLDLGDTPSALDAIDDVTYLGYWLGTGSPSVDHAALLTVKPMDNLTVHLSGAADSNYGTTATAGYAYSARYKVMDAVTLGAGQMNNDDGSEALLLNATASLGAFGLGYEMHTDTTAAGVDTDTTTMGATYKMGSTLLGVEAGEVESQGTVSSEDMTYFIHHKIVPGLTAYAEFTDDAKQTNDETTLVGLAMKF